MNNHTYTHYFFITFVITLIIISSIIPSVTPSNNLPYKKNVNLRPHSRLNNNNNNSKIQINKQVYDTSKQLCLGCIGQSLEFLVHHNLVRARKLELPLMYDTQLEKYAAWWAGQRRADCALEHSFPEGGFELGENVFWGGGDQWAPKDAVEAWASEEKYYDYESNSCEDGQMCGHYTQIVWSKTRKVGCARVVCDDGDVFMSCNYYPPGNYVGERPY